MSEKKKIWHTGITASEKKLLPRLRTLSGEGYILTKMTGFYYEVTPSDDRTEKEYLLDIHKETADKEDYLAGMIAAGWTLAAEWDEFFYFFGKPGTAPKYSDTYKDVKPYEAIRKTNMGISSICAVFIFILIVAGMSAPSLFAGIYGIATIIAGFIIVLFFISTLKVSIDYEKRIERIKDREKPF